MPESSTAIGTRDNLLLDTSRCQRTRFSESSCQHCQEICPHAAISLENGLTINPELCRGCLLCTSACPVGALEQSNNFAAALAELSKVPDPVLGCIRNGDRSHATLACLGGLSPEHLLALFYTLSGRLTLNLSLCSDCPNNSMVSILKQRLSGLSGAGLSHGSCRIELAESAEQVPYHCEAIDRRAFFRAFSASLFSSAADILAAPNPQSNRRTEYGGKRLPARRELLNRTMSRLSNDAAQLLQQHFDSLVTIQDSCTGCHGCAAICPTGALQADTINEKPSFKPLSCTGCGLCVQFCLDEALLLETPNN